MKSVKFVPLDERMNVKTGARVLDALLAKELNVLMACGGKGVCATCHVRVREGMDHLSPMTEREKRTLGFVSGADPASRLSCQCRILGDNVVVEVPEGMYLERAEDLLTFLGSRAVTDILHPIHGGVLIPKGKIITRTRLEELRRVDAELAALKSSQSQL